MTGNSGCEGKAVFVSGASRGLGAGLATRFLERGMRLVVCARSEPALSPSADVIARRLDVRDESELDALVGEAEARFGAIDLWINNAGLLEPIDPVRDVALEAFREHVDVNLTGVFLGTRSYVRHLRRVGRSGALVNISSGAATKAYRGWGAYCATKAAVDQFTRVVAEEEAEIGLRAYSVAPGVIDTDMQALVRATPESRFPDAPVFQERKESGAFNSPRFVADELLEIAFGAAQPDRAVAFRLPDEPR